MENRLSPYLISFVRFLFILLLFFALLIFQEAISSAVYWWPLITLGLVVGWWPIVRDAFLALRRKQFELKFVISITIVAALLAGRELMALALVLLILGGDEFVAAVLRKTDERLKSIIGREPTKSEIKVGREIKEVEIRKIRKNDIVVVRPGARVPVDGELLSEKALVSEAFLSGEPAPVLKNRGDEVLAGSVASDSYFEIKAAGSAGEGTYSVFRSMIDKAKQSKLRLAMTMMMSMKYITFTIVAFSVVVFIITQDVTRLLAMWISGVPVGLIAAVPIAVLAGIGTAAKRGVLIKSAEHLENLGKVSTIVFDKTGTLTEGKFGIRAIQSFADFSAEGGSASGGDDKEVLRLAATAELQSEHALAKAIVSAAKEENLRVEEPKEFVYEKGMGVKVKTAKGEILAGRLEFLAKNGIKPSEEILGALRETSKNGFYTPVFVSFNKNIAGIVYLGDKIKVGAAETIENLKDLGITDLWILSGDREENVRFVAEKLGIKNYAAGLLPDEKVAKIKELAEAKKAVMMVGDGINDAPALAAATIGTAMGGRGNDLSVESSDIILLAENLEEVPRLVRLGRKTVSLIRQDIVAAGLFHLVMLILAAFGFIGFLGAAIIHETSATFVILNTSRLMFGMNKKN